MNAFTRHPNAVGETYLQHMAFALRFGGRMLRGGAAAILHALFPFLCVTTASRINDQLVAMRAASAGRTARTSEHAGAYGRRRCAVRSPGDAVE